MNAPQSQPSQQQQLNNSAQQNHMQEQQPQELQHQQQQQSRFQPQHMLQRPPSANEQMHPHSNMRTPTGQQQQQLTQHLSPSHHAIIGNQQQHNNQQQQEWSNWNNHNHQQQQQLQQTGNEMQPLGTAGGGDMFNQSDRINLNTRLKTMILNKNDDPHGAGIGAQQAASTQSQTGHFLSYSHHLRDLNHSATTASGDGVTNAVDSAATGGGECLASGSGPQQQHQHQQQLSAQQQQSHALNNASVGHSAVTEPIGGGGDSGWKSSVVSKNNDFHPYDTKKNDMMDFGRAAADGADLSDNKKPTEPTAKVKSEPEKKKRIRKKPAANTTSAGADKSTNANSDPKSTATTSFLPSVNSSRIFSTPNPPTPYSSGYGSDTNPPHLTSPLHVTPRYDSFQSSKVGGTSTSNAFDATLKIKQEPAGAYAGGAGAVAADGSQQSSGSAGANAGGAGDAQMMDMSQVKMEGYERNYQNFINYADYCQSQNQKNNQQQQHFEYNPNQDYANAMANCGSSQSSYNGSSNGGGVSGGGSSSGNGNGGNGSNFSPYQQSQFQNNFNQFAHGGSNSSSSNSSNAAPPVPSQHSIHSMMATAGEVNSKDASASQSLPSVDLKTTLTNYEKEIPVYTYPNPGRMQHQHTMNSKPLGGHEPMDGGMHMNGPTHGYPPYGGRSETDRDGGNQHTTAKTESMYGADDVGNADLASVRLTADADAEKSSAQLGKDASSAPNAVDRTEKGSKPEVPDCDCFQSDKNPPEPGSYYTHLGRCWPVAIETRTTANQPTCFYSRLDRFGRQSAGIAT